MVDGRVLRTDANTVTTASAFTHDNNDNHEFRNYTYMPMF